MQLGHILLAPNRLMDHFDDIQIEEFSSFDFVEEMNECLFDDDKDDKTFNSFLNSNTDY